MPITRSAKKQVRTQARKRVVNSTGKKNMKRSMRAVVEGGAENLSAAYKAIDKATKRGLVHKRKAARLKSHLAKRVSSKTA